MCILKLCEWLGKRACMWEGGELKANQRLNQMDCTMEFSCNLSILWWDSIHLHFYLFFCHSNLRGWVAIAFSLFNFSLVFFSLLLSLTISKVFETQTMSFVLLILFTFFLLPSQDTFYAQLKYKTWVHCKCKQYKSMYGKSSAMYGRSLLKRMSEVKEHIERSWGHAPVYRNRFLWNKFINLYGRLNVDRCVMNIVLQYRNLYRNLFSVNIPMWMITCIAECKWKANYSKVRMWRAA